MKILVTGGCGFLGSHICELFLNKGWDVVAYDNLTKFEYSRIPYFDIERVRDYNYNLLYHLGVITYVDDIRNQKTLMKVAAGCDLIAHCAAQPAMTIAIEDPQLDFSVNVQGTLNVLECAKQKDIPIVNCSTIHVYGNGINEELDEVPEGLKSIVDATVPKPIKEGFDRFYRHPPTIREDNPILTGILSPLHASKRTAEIYVQAYIDTYGIKAANFRLTGIYGPRQFGGEDHGWVANFAIRTILGLPIKIFGTDKQVRDILYVKDAAMAFYKWFEAGCPSGTYNIGGGEDCITSLKGCLEILKRQTDTKQKIEILPARQGDLYYFCCDTDRAKEEFGWAPRVLPCDGINDLVYWIRENKEIFKS